MRRQPCAGLAELRSALVDNALNDADRDRVLVHLAGCDSCRIEVEDLRRVRQLLTQSRSHSAAPYDLSHRLVSIAGSEARAPLWCRPFRRTRSGALPSARRVVRVRTTAAVLALGTLVATAGGVGYAAAPPLALTAINDPSTGARTEFAAALAQFPLSSDSVNAAMMAPGDELAEPTGATVSSPVGGSLDHELGGDEARRTLRRAAEAADQLSYHGVQTVVARSDASRISATVTVDQQRGQGNQVSVYSSKGAPVSTGFTADLSVPRMDDDDLIALLLRSYSVSARAGTQVADRDATLVEASTRGSAFLPRTPVARWWIDNATGLLLWQETYDPYGSVKVSSGFTSVSVGGPGAFIQHLAPTLAVPSTTAALTLSSVGSLTSQGWACQDALVGLSLVRLRSSEGAAPGVLHMVYSDGLTSLGVFEQRGALRVPPADSPWNDALGAYVRSGVMTHAIWQSGGTVFTVVTDGSPEMLERAVADLPHDRPLARTTMERIQAGWSRIRDSLIG